MKLEDSVQENFSQPRMPFHKQSTSVDQLQYQELRHILRRVLFPSQLH